MGCVIMRCTCVNSAANDRYIYSLNMRPGKITLWARRQTPLIGFRFICLCLITATFPVRATDSPRQRSCNCFGRGGSSPGAWSVQPLKKTEEKGSYKYTAPLSYLQNMWRVPATYSVVFFKLNSGKINYFHRGTAHSE